MPTFNFQDGINYNRISNSSSEERSRSFTVFAEDLKIILLSSFFRDYKFSSEKVIRFHQKKKKKRKRLIMIKFPDMNLA